MQFLLYCLCGGIGVTIDYAIYYFSLSLGLWYQAANLLGYLSGTLVSFFLNRKITFGIHDQVAKRLMFFLGVAALGFLASALMLWFFVDTMSVNPKIAKLLTLPLVIIIQFSMNRWLTFRKSLQR